MASSVRTIVEYMVTLMLSNLSDIYGAPKDDKYVSVLLHPGLKQLPKSYIVSAGKDTLRDDGRLMAEALREGGVEVIYDEFAGYPHYFWTFPSKHLTSTSERYFEKLVAGHKFVVS
jgi:versiconal hemiacetal acetate esterase